MQLIVEKASGILLIDRLVQRELGDCSRSNNPFSSAELTKVIHFRLVVEVDLRRLVFLGEFSDVIGNSCLGRSRLEFSP